jgi:DtxR family manganese transport transcriptional regulator
MKRLVNARSIPFSQTRTRHRKETAEDYVEAIQDVVAEFGTCRVRDLAEHFNVSHVTVSRIVKRLQEEELLTTKPYQPIELTSEGDLLAKRVKARHNVVFEFLIALGVDSSSAEIDSEGIEHYVGSATLAAMKKYTEGHGL